MVNSISGGSFYGPVLLGHSITVTDHGGMAPRAPQVPRMLPYGPDGFVDRDEARARLDGLLAGRDGRAAPLLVLLHGTQWVGKTGLVLHWARQRQEEFPGGTFYADLSPLGAGDPAAPAAVLESFIGTTGTPKAELPGDEEALAARFRSLTGAAPSLVVLDGVVRAAQVARLLPGHPASMVVMTSRFRLGAIETAQARLPVRIAVGELGEEACAELFRLVAGEEVPASGEAFESVIRAAAGLPLVVRVAAAQAADPLLDGVEGLAARISGQESVLEVIGMSLDRTYRTLDPAAQRGLRTVGAHPGTECADALLDDLAPGARAALHAAGLLERAGPGRSRINAALHGWARTELRDEELAGQVADWYVRRAGAAERLLSGRWRYTSRLRQPPDPEAWFATKAQAVMALEPDRNNLVAVARLCLTTDPAALCELAESVHALFFECGHHSLWIDIVRPAVEAAGRLGDPLLLARMHYELAFALAARGSAEDLEEAREQYDKARESARRSGPGGHPRTESSALEGLGLLAARTGDPLAAMDLYARALDALGPLEHPRGRALLRLHRGTAALLAGRHTEADTQLAVALHEFESLAPADHGNAAKSRLRLAMARLGAGRPAEAEEPLREALAEFTAPTVNRADALLVRGDLRAALGDPTAARADWREALELYERLGSVRAEEPRIRLARDGGGSPEEA